jgi:predicted dehydrogenase
VLAVACGHVNDDRSSKLLAQKCDAQAYSNWADVVKRRDIESIVICTPPHLHSQIALEAFDSGKHVLCEKPLARTVAEAEQMVDKAREAGLTLKCGFNHRHHPAILQAKKYVDSNLLGKLHFARSRYGICGRQGLEKEWRANPAFASGGQLMEQGIHSIDLFRWFLGEPKQITAVVSTLYWNIAPLEDNAFAIMKTHDGKLAELHTSLTSWKNTFSFDIFGDEGYISTEGLGGSYGTERLVHLQKDFTKPFREQIVEYRGEDQSWNNEWNEFETAIAEHREPLGNGEDGLQAMRIVTAAYSSSKENATKTIT